MTLMANVLPLAKFEWSLTAFLQQLVCGLQAFPMIFRTTASYIWVVRIGTAKISVSYGI